ncbi:MAG: hypothetical protein LBO02_01105 [Holosporaceae bacterium]|jgi:hypothetical protein|nr:hypothetical protein [Holosporaceae bacterium]
MSIFAKLKKHCHAEYVCRNQLRDITGGIISGKTMAKLDIKGKGIKNRKIIGKRTIYRIDDLVQWLENNTRRVK